MNEYKFTVEEASKFAKEDRLEEWIHLFLNSIGNNKGLSEGLKLEKRYYIGPVFVDLDQLKRCCGPEPDMEYHNSAETWEPQINKFRGLIQEGWDMPPLICHYTEGVLSVRDGNHRHEALVREGIKKFHTIIWSEDLNSLNDLSSTL